MPGYDIISGKKSQAEAEKHPDIPGNLRSLPGKLFCSGISLLGYPAPDASLLQKGLTNNEMRDNLNILQMEHI